MSTLASPSSPAAADIGADALWLRSFVRRLAAPSDVDDVAQDTWLGALRRGSAPRPLLAGIARRIAALRVRREARRLRREQARCVAHASPATLDLVLRQETLQRVAAAVHALPEPYRSTLLDHHQGGVGVAELGAREGVAPAAIRKRLQRARELVRARLAVEFGDEPRARRALLVAVGALPWTASSLGLAVTVALAAAAWVMFSFASALGDERGPSQPQDPMAGRAHTVASETVAGVRAIAREAAPLASLPREPATAGTQQDGAAALPRWRLLITVRDAEGAPVQHAVVRLGGEDKWSDAAGACRFDEAGELAKLPDRIVARRLPAAGNAEAPRWLVVREGLRALRPAGGGDVVIELRFGDPTLAIRGQVLGADRQPARGIAVLLAVAEPIDPDRPFDLGRQPLEDLTTSMEGEAVMGQGACTTTLFAITGDDGAFVLRGLRAREYRLRAIDSRDGRTVVSPPLAAGSVGVVLQLPEAAPRAVSGIVRDPRGQPLAGVEVVALVPLLRVGDVDDFEAVGGVRSAANGSFTIAAPRAAEWIGVRSRELVCTRVLLRPEQRTVELCTDRPHALRLEAGGWPADACVELLDVRERPMPMFFGTDGHPPVDRGAVRFVAGRDVFTRGDAVMVRLLAADGRTLAKLPLALRAEEPVVVRAPR